MNYLMKSIYTVVLIVFGLSNTPAQIESSSHPSVADAVTIWKGRRIDVCWENPTDRFREQIEHVKTAIGSTWELHSGLSFNDWGKCRANSRGIRILIADEWPRVKALGSRLDGLANGMVLNFVFQHGFTCSGNHFECIRIIAIHEFGHAIGLAHEQNRADTNPQSLCFQNHFQGSIENEYQLTKWDLESVMNYCNPRWNGNGELSEHDIAGIQTLYGLPVSDVTREIDIRSCIGRGGVQGVTFWGPRGQPCNGIQEWGTYGISSSESSIKLCRCKGKGGVLGVTLWGPKGNRCGGFEPWGQYSESCIDLRHNYICACKGRGNMIGSMDIWGPSNEWCGGFKEWGTYSSYCQ